MLPLPCNPDEATVGLADAGRTAGGARTPTLGQRIHRLLGGVTMLAAPTCAEWLRRTVGAQDVGWGAATHRFLMGDIERPRATAVVASITNGGGGVVAGVDDGVATVLVVIVVVAKRPPLLLRRGVNKPECVIKAGANIGVMAIGSDGMAPTACCGGPTMLRRTGLAPALRN